MEPLVQLTLAEAMGEEEGGPGRGLSLSQFSQLLTAGNTSLALYDARTARPPRREGEDVSVKRRHSAGAADKAAGSCTACLIC